MNISLFKLGKTIRIVLEDGTVLANTNCTDDFYSKAMLYINLDDKESLLDLFCPERALVKLKIEEVNNVTKQSKIVTFENAFYIKSISELTVPENLAKAIVKAENENNTILLESYLNFWKLLSCNPNENVRNNLLWFIDKHDIKITQNGLLITYRNVDVRNLSKFNVELLLFISTEAAKMRYNEEKMSKFSIYYNDFVKKYDIVEDKDTPHFNTDRDCTFIGKLNNLYKTIVLENEELEFTDRHSRTMSIKLGKLITMPREEVDSDSNHECSRGLMCSPII